MTAKRTTPIRVITTLATINDRKIAELSALAEALEAQDWDKVATVAIHLKDTDRMIRQFGADADYVQAYLGHRVVR